MYDVKWANSNQIINCTAIVVYIKFTFTIYAIQCNNLKSYISTIIYLDGILI